MIIVQFLKYLSEGPLEMTGNLVITYFRYSILELSVFHGDLYVTEVRMLQQKHTITHQQEPLAHYLQVSDPSPIASNDISSGLVTTILTDYDWEEASRGSVSAHIHAHTGTL